MAPRKTTISFPTKRGTVSFKGTPKSKTTKAAKRPGRK